jgi:DNA-binding MarR family transcriptional regulator
MNSSQTVVSSTATGPQAGINELREALNHMFGAERRLRGRDHSRPGQLTFGQLRLIGALGRERKMTAGQLAKSADLNPASVTAILDDLEAAGIVQRHRGTEDRRVCNVSLTPQGWQLLERKLAGWQALWAHELAHFTDAEIQVAARVIQRITGILDSLPSRIEHCQPAKEIH